MEIERYFIENYTFEKKNVIIRVDWNVPINKNNLILDFFRINSSLKSINYIYKQNPNRIIIISHLGRPNDMDKNKYSWKNYIDQIRDIINFPNLLLLENGLSENTLIQLNENKSKIYLLENIRFHQEEVNYSNKNSKSIQEIFNKLGDIYINDAFSCMHRNHLSICGYNKNNQVSYGYLVKREIDYFNLLINNTKDKKLAIIGGGKIEDKILLLINLSKKVDGIYIAGGLINSLLKDKNMDDLIKNIKKNKANIYFMEDGIAAEDQYKLDNYYESKNLPINKNFYDIGNKSLQNLENIINEYDIIFWNGTIGVVENEKYKNGSLKLIEILMKSNKRIIVGGGDTAALINKHKNNFEFISTAGGALIEYISNNTLIGLDYFIKNNI